MTDKVCPNCKCVFQRRKDGGCPACAVPLALVKGKAVLQPVYDEQKKKQVERHTAAIIAVKQLDAHVRKTHKGYIPPFAEVGSKEWKEQVSMAGSLYDRCQAYLSRQTTVLPITVSEFFLRLIEMILQDSYWHYHVQTMAQLLYAAQKFALELWKQFKVQTASLLKEMERIAKPTAVSAEELDYGL